MSLLLLRVWCLTFEYILVFLYPHDEVGRKHRLISFYRLVSFYFHYFPHILSTYGRCYLVSSNLLSSRRSLYFIASFMYSPAPPPRLSYRFNSSRSAICAYCNKFLSYRNQVSDNVIISKGCW